MSESLTAAIGPTPIVGESGVELIITVNESLITRIGPVYTITCSGARLNYSTIYTIQCPFTLTLTANTMAKFFSDLFHCWMYKAKNRVAPFTPSKNDKVKLLSLRFDLRPV